MKKKPIDLGNRIHLIDGFDLGLPSRTGTYVIKDEALTLVETGPSMSIPYILNGLKELNLDPKDVQYIIVTHIHLDHAGGAGLLLQDCPNAKIVVHPKGARHLANPTRLILGAKAVYGDDFERLFDPILPIPEDKLMIKEDGETLKLSTNCELTFYHTPGHADHHFSIYDPISNGMFTGDTIGVRYDQIKEFEFYLPSTSPNQFRPDDMMISLNKIINELNVERIFFGHFSMSSNPTEVYKQISYWLPKFVAIGEAVYSKGQDHEALSSEIMSVVKETLENKNIPEEHHVYELINLDLHVCSMGIIDYLNKRK
ncbi:MBL fold metallo-hydrolase [Anaerobacillus isosaccharinicus]|uniref:MBL fold metallo-hydrolase n=1 Tax=Anaerobacillus isosaccharinicus TaxID=1532552 RepID=A0A1S2MCS1_9BACI|nr:MBL fold metallo-hydrolase [Anaerobacillus isosaccharinicus]MBA5585923.1 MBL fold metallo-hydrolase [Anaerobacillus isosaccharinicus]QOY35789.1 MBL fold metallo-hydrolase [Anaerobacillus isosaccharinicus]